MKELSHITFVVQDLERATTFFKRIFGAKEVYESGDETFSVAKEKYTGTLSGRLKRYQEGKELSGTSGQFK